MDPATLSIVALTSTALGAATSAVGAISSANAQSDAAKYQAGVARNNQIIAQQNASAASSAGAVQAQNRDFKNRALEGGILAAQSASGIDTSSTTSKMVRDSQAEVDRLDTATIMSNALQQARSYVAEGQNQGAQAQLDESRASAASTAGVFSVGSSILGGASSFADKWTRYQTTGVPGFANT